MDNSKKCSKCKSFCINTEFYKNKSTKDGLSYHCKKCNKKYSVSNKEHKSKIMRDYRQTNPLRPMLMSARQRAKKKKLEFNLCIEDLKIPDVCPVLGIAIQKGSRRFCDNAPSLDRIDNTKGYTLENTIIVSSRANRLKSDSTLNELRKIVDFYQKMYNTLNISE